MTIEKQPFRVAVYARVSTDKQEVLNQLSQLREKCKKEGWEIWGEYWDITSGTQDSRPSWDQMFLHAHQGKFDLVLFWSLDRFSRSGTLYTLQKLNELTACKVGWLSYQEQYLDSAGQFKDVVISIMATIAKIEREKISERTKAGLARAKNVGKRGKDKKPRKWRADKGIKRGVVKDKVIAYMEAKEKKTVVFNDTKKEGM
jgi:DNA invertase Pin-like site-specific DNA recombinase